MGILFHKITRFYRNLRLQTKLTITHLVIVTIPMVAIPVLFFTQLYDMIVADTVRKEFQRCLKMEIHRSGHTVRSFGKR